VLGVWGPRSPTPDVLVFVGYHMSVENDPFLGDRICKTVRHAIEPLSVMSVCLSVYGVGVLWPNGWMDQDATWYGHRPQP